MKDSSSPLVQPGTISVCNALQLPSFLELGKIDINVGEEYERVFFVLGGISMTGRTFSERIGGDVFGEIHLVAFISLKYVILLALRKIQNTLYCVNIQVICLPVASWYSCC